MNGDVQQKSWLKTYLTNRRIETALETLLLILAGAFAITLHARLRIPMNIPGHHGVEFMAIILAARLSSSMKWASSISAAGIGIFILFPVLGFNDPMMGFNYMLPCFLIDFAWQKVKDSKYASLLLSIAAGFAYMLIPVSRLIITFTIGYPYASFMKHGYITPVATFFIFGVLGGLLGTGLYKLGKRLLSKH